MAFKVGAIYGEAKLDTKKWENGTSKINSTLNKSLNAVKNFAIGASAAFAGYVVLSTKKADTFQKSLSNVNTLLSSGQANVAGMSRELLTLDSSLGSTIDLTEGLYQAISAGADPATNAIDVVVDSAKFAKAALTDTATAVDVLTTAVNAYGAESVSTQKASDIFFTTIKQGKINGEQLSSVIGQSIPLFASVGIPIEELSSGLAAMTKQGVSAAESTTQLNAIVNSFLKPSNELNDVLTEMGFASGSAFLEAEGLAGALDLLSESTGGDAAELAKLLPNVRALRGAMALTGTGGEEFTNILKEMESSAGATDEAFQKQEKTWATLANSFGKNQIIVGNMAKFFADDLAGGLDDALTSVNDFLLSEEGFDKISNVIIKVAGGFSVFKDIATDLFDSIGNVFQGALDTFNSEIKDLSTNSGEAIDSFDTMAVISQTLASGLTITGKILNLVITGIFNLGKIAKDSFDTVSAFVRFVKGEASFDEVKDNFKDFGDGIGEFVVDFKDGIVDIIDTTIEEIDTFNTRSEEQADKLRNIWDNSTKEMSKKVVDNYEKMVLGAENSIEDLKDSSEKGGGESGDKLTSAFMDKINAASTKMKTTWDNFIAPVIDSAVFVAQQIADAYNAIFDTIEMAMQNELALLQAQNQEKLDNLMAANEEKLTAFDDQHTAELTALEESYNAGLLTEQQYLDQKALIEENYAMGKADLEAKLDKKLQDQKKKLRDKENAKKKEIFEAQKANQIANVWIQYAIGLAGLWAQSIAQLGPIAGSILAGIMTGVLTGVAVAQTVLISQQQFIPEKAVGGMAGGLTRVNEKGGEIISLPDGSQVIPNDISRQIAANSGSSGNQINIYPSFKGATISDNMSLRKVSAYVANDFTEKLRGIM